MTTQASKEAHEDFFIFSRRMQEKYGRQYRIKDVSESEREEGNALMYTIIMLHSANHEAGVRYPCSVPNPESCEFSYRGTHECVAPVVCAFRGANPIPKSKR